MPPRGGRTLSNSQTLLKQEQIISISSLETSPGPRTQDCVSLSQHRVCLLREEGCAGQERLPVTWGLLPPSPRPGFAQGRVSLCPCDWKKIKS